MDRKLSNCKISPIKSAQSQQQIPNMQGASTLQNAPMLKGAPTLFSSNASKGHLNSYLNQPYHNIYTENSENSKPPTDNIHRSLHFHHFGENQNVHPRTDLPHRNENQNVVHQRLDNSYHGENKNSVHQRIDNSYHGESKNSVQRTETSYRGNHILHTQLQSNTQIQSNIQKQSSTDIRKNSAHYSSFNAVNQPPGYNNTIDKPTEKIVYKDRIIEKPVEKIVYIDKLVEKIVYEEKIVEKPQEDKMMSAKKADELKLIEKLDNLIDNDEVIKTLGKQILKGDSRAMSLYFGYRYGKPKESVDITSSDVWIGSYFVFMSIT